MKRKCSSEANEPNEPKSITIRYNKKRMELYGKKISEYNELIRSSTRQMADVLKKYRMNRNSELELKDIFEEFKDEEQKIKNPLNVLIIRNFTTVRSNGTNHFLQKEYWYFPSGSLPIIHHSYKQELAVQKNELDYLRSNNGRVVSESDVKNLPVDHTETCEIKIFEFEK